MHWSRTTVADRVKGGREAGYSQELGRAFLFDVFRAMWGSFPMLFWRSGAFFDAFWVMCFFESFWMIFL